LLKNIKAVSLMAVVGLLISALIIGFGLFYALPVFGIDMPISVSLLFGAIISATDPVSVVALFKEYGAPKRLGLLFEGESLFNDGTAVALFVIILGVIAEYGGVFSVPVLLDGFEVFLSLIFLGIAFGLLSGYIFSKAMGLIKDENVQITFSLLSAHLTFLLAEVITEEVKIGSFDVHISGIIATVISALVIGNFGRYKLSPKAEYYTNKF
jgi:CPA1 family monovalent cation:H+ antiporter